MKINGGAWEVMTVVCLRIAKKFEWRKYAKPGQGLVYFVVN
jgi:hypothetical protein